MRSIAIDQSRIDEVIDFSWRLHRSDPEWIPPIRARLRQELTGADAFGAYGRMQIFGAHTGSELVGRVAAIVNPKLTDADGHVIGQVGYFEAIDDDQVAASLFGAAFEWLRAHGARRVWGPMNGAAHRAHRLMTAGFDRTAFLFEPRNPPYYPRLFERAGFARSCSWTSMDASAEQLHHALATLPMFQINDHVKDRYDLARPEPWDPALVLQRFYPLLDRMWSGHLGYVPLDLAEFAEAFGPALALMSGDNLLWVVDRHTRRDLGCAFVYPDYAAEVRALDGDATGWGQWLAGGKLPRRLVLHTMGVAREARGRGVAMWLLRRMVESCVDHYVEGTFALVIHEFVAIRKIAAPTREYALFERPID